MTAIRTGKRTMGASIGSTARYFLVLYTRYTIVSTPVVYMSLSEEDAGDKEWYFALADKHPWVPRGATR